VQQAVPSDSKSILFIEFLSKLNHAKNPTERADSPLERTQSGVKDEKNEARPAGSGEAGEWRTVEGINSGGAELRDRGCGTSWGGLLSPSIGDKAGTNDENDRWQNPQSGSI
jgi:hypothetical protein